MVGPGARCPRELVSHHVSSDFLCFCFIFRQISTQVVAAMATAVIDICSSISALRQGRGTSPGNLAEVLGAAVIAHPWPTEAIMTVLCAFTRPRSMPTLGTGEEGSVPQHETYELRGGGEWYPLYTLPN